MNRQDHKLGVLIAVKDTIVALSVIDLDSESEIMWIQIEIAKSKPLFIGPEPIKSTIYKYKYLYSALNIIQCF